jgi:DNA-binding NtrC family response regulator
LFAEVSEPLYLLDEQRRIVFANQAACDWLEVVAGDVLGRVCRYQSGDANPPAALVDSLCPPPEAFHGQKSTGTICRQTVAGRLEQRRADFIPLAGEGERWVGVLVIVRDGALSTDDQSSDEVQQRDGHESRRLHDSIRRFRSETARWHHAERLVGQSPAMVRVREQIKLASSGKGTVLIVGSPGIGRQHVARAIHAATAQQHPNLCDQGTGQDESVTDSKAENPLGAFVPVSCSVLPPELLWSTVAALSNRCRRALSGPVSTLLLADVDQLAPEIQPEFNRWFAEVPPNLRVISTSRELLESVSERGNLRADLAQRLSTLVIQLPPLADRREDIPLLAQMFLEDLNAQGGKQLRGFKLEAMDRLVLYDWPRQADELATITRQAFAQAEGFEITPGDLPKQLRLAAEAVRFSRQSPESIDLEKFMARVESELIDRALRQAKGNKSQAARLLGMTRPRLYRRMEQLGLDVGEEDASP